MMRDRAVWRHPRQVTKVSGPLIVEAAGGLSPRLTTPSSDAKKVESVGSVLAPGLGCFEKLGAQLRILLVIAAPVGRPRPRVTLAHASHLRAEAHCVEVHSDAVGL